MKVMGIIGSPHRNGNTAYLLKHTFKVIGESHQTEIIFLKDYNLKPCEGCHRCNRDGICIIEDGMQELYKKLQKADAIILASPSYMGGVTSRLKIFMERCWHLRKGKLEGKIGSYIIAGRRKIGLAPGEIMECLARLKLIILPGVLGYGFGKGSIKEDTEALQEAKRLGQAVISSLDR